MMRASCSTRSKRFHCGFSASRSLPSTSAKREPGCLRWSHSSRSTVRVCPDSSSARETRAEASCAATFSQRASRCSYDPSSGVPKGCRKTGTNHSASTGSVASTNAAARRWPRWGGSKLPPKSAISSGIEQKPRALLQEGRALRVPERAELVDSPALLRLLAERLVAGEQVDGRLVLDELVLLGAPAELRRILRPRMDDGRDAQAHRVHAARVAQVDLDALAALAAVLVPGGSERARPEEDPVQALGGEVAREPLPVEPGRTEHLEGPGGAPALAEVRAFEQAHPRIDERRLRRGHVGRWRHPGQARVVEVHVAAPALQGNDVQVGADALVHVARVLPGGEAVARAHRPQAHERLVARVHHAALDR